MGRLAFLAGPRTISQHQCLVDRATRRTRLGTGKPRADMVDHGSKLSCDMVQNAGELVKTEITDFPAPEPLHPFQIQRLKVDVAGLLAELPRQLKVKVFPLIGNMFMHTGQTLTRLMPVTRSFLLTRQATVRFFQSIPALLKEQRCLKRLPITADEKSLKPEIQSDLMTRYANGSQRFHLTGKVDEQFPQRIPLDRDGLNASCERARVGELIALFPNAQDVVADQTPPCLC